MKMQVEKAEEQHIDETSLPENPGCYACRETGTPGGIWYMGLEASGQANYSCANDAEGLFNVFRVRAAP